MYQQQAPFQLPLQHINQQVATAPGLFVLPKNPDTANYYAADAYGRQRHYHHHGFLHPALRQLRFLVIWTFIGTIISAGLVKNKDFAVRTVSRYDTAVWVSTLVFACVGFLVSLLIYILNLFLHSRILNLLAAIFDIIWFVPMLILGAFCAKRENDNFGDFRNVSLNKTVFGITSAFAILTAVILFFLALLGFAYAFRLREPKQGLLA